MPSSKQAFCNSCLLDIFANSVVLKQNGTNQQIVFANMVAPKYLFWNGTPLKTVKRKILPFFFLYVGKMQVCP